MKGQKEKENKANLVYKSEFLNSLISNNYSDKTVLSYARDLDAFENFLHLRGLSFKNINKRVIDDYKGLLLSTDHLSIFKIQFNSPTGSNYEEGRRKLNVSNSRKTLSSTTINRMLTSLRRYLKYLLVNDLPCPLSPEKIDFLRKEKKISPLAEYGDLLKLLEAPYNLEENNIVKERNRAFLELLFATGMRISEACSLNIDQIGYYEDVDKKDFKFNEKFFITGKGKKQRFVYLTERSVYYLRLYLKTRRDKYPALFIPTKGRRRNEDDIQLVRVSQNYFQLKISQYRKQLGINVKTSAHSLRHGFATYMAENGANIVALQTLLGHESLTTTTRYIHSSDKLAEEAHKEFHPTNSL